MWRWLGVGCWVVSSLLWEGDLGWCCPVSGDLSSSLAHPSAKVCFLGQFPYSEPCWGMWHMSTALLYMRKEGLFCSVGRVDSLWPRCWGCLEAKHCSAKLEESSGRFLIANVWHSCFALILKKPYTPKKKCKVTEKHTKWWAVQSKAVWKAFNSALLFQNHLCCFPPRPCLPLLAHATAPTASPHIFCCWVTVCPVPLLLHRVHVCCTERISVALHSTAVRLFCNCSNTFSTVPGNGRSVFPSLKCTIILSVRSQDLIFHWVW